VEVSASSFRSKGALGMMMVVTMTKRAARRGGTQPWRGPAGGQADSGLSAVFIVQPAGSLAARREMSSPGGGSGRVYRVRRPAFRSATGPRIGAVEYGGGGGSLKL